MSPRASATIRMYRLNELGDCFLVTLRASRKKSHLLIDCGSFRNGQDSQDRLTEIVDAIAAELDGDPLDVVVGTHQHNDHVSGFVHCLAAFQQMQVGEVWLSWLDDPRDRTARRLGDAHNNLMRRLAGARDALHDAPPSAAGGRPSVAARAREVLDDVLGFYGAGAKGEPPELPAEGVRNLKALGREKPRYLRPGQSLDVPGLPEGSVRVHVLGPPRDDALLYRKDPRSGESYDHALAAASTLASRFLDAARGAGGDAPEDAQYPFNREYKRPAKAAASGALADVRARYDAADDAWRTIDDEWMRQAETLSLFLDTYTNNSSLVLAIELVESGKVLLFAADAQTGNWTSWRDVRWKDASVDTDDLLARTVFYKVGHHASHNATLVDAFEHMDHPELVAFIPVHKQDPNITKKNGWKMPATNLFKRIVEKTEHRVLQMDGAQQRDCDPERGRGKAGWERIGVTPAIDDLAITIEIEG